MASQSGPPYDPSRTGPWLVCRTCGTQFPTDDKHRVTTCPICDDPRQYVPPTGQSFVSLDILRSGGYSNVFTLIPGGLDRLIAINTQPKAAIGQRAILVRAPRGNVLWDCVTLLDDETIAKIRDLGGLDAIVISHPHYYSTHLEWARAFDCPVYLAGEDKEWLTQEDATRQRFITETETDILGTKILKLGGHFPGSLVMLFESRLLIADTFLATPSGIGNWETDAVGTVRERPRGMSSFSFMWSYPNMIPLGPDALGHMWAILKRYEFSSTHGAFPGMDIITTSRDMKHRVLESMKLQIRYSGHEYHAMLNETVV
ncbi:putative metallo-beta-lactamase family protein [Rosellinia necatrix]|uniref:Putative metallo-beta-lactamase family protein n=1 Tax=Rosellinia necatrix TaxID=77044 RepID=A0A1W2TSW9_ROSNE|nr:putative metallo-beta-lactamase family protein [Rosellinia necatrix]